MKQTGEKRILRSDYKEPNFLIPQIDLTFNLHDSSTMVTNMMEIIRNGHGSDPLVLNGEKLKLLSVEIDGRTMDASEYDATEASLVITDVPDRFTLKLATEINPRDNQALEGLYKSGKVFCTQNEPEGFRKITFFIDRPDVMSRFTTKIIGDSKSCPVLLANGNLVEEVSLGDGRHWVKWEDPFPKPAYLFALVAGDLGLVRDSFTTMSGRTVDLRIYCDPGNESRCYHAMESLKKAMKWDEERFGLEYDLDIYMIVAVDTFNMGAMENKGLNVFNSHYVLANPETATDTNYLGIESVIAHEYFHNWTGNRVTLRDWFQLTLKEGLTVFRDQEFSSDIQSRPVQRILDVNGLRTVQFTEDAGPNAHPIRPDSYLEINNFYTATVYEKGAEVIRMIHTILGEEGFQKGMWRYFELHDGHAVTCDDFVHAMESATDTDLAQFRLWYSRAGTPVLAIETGYDQEKRQYAITVRQDIPREQNREDTGPMHMPLAVGLLDARGRDMLGEDGTVVLQIREREERFVFEGINEKPVPSLNRNFSAPVRIDYAWSHEELKLLFMRDSDAFNRWDAGQVVTRGILKDYVTAIQRGVSCSMNEDIAPVFGAIIDDEAMDKNFKALMLELPYESILVQEYSPVDFNAIHEARNCLRREMGCSFRDGFHRMFMSLEGKGEFSLSMEAMGKRALRLRALDYLVETGEDEFLALCHDLYEKAGNMTDALGALSLLAGTDNSYRDRALTHFYEKWKHDQVVITKWFSVQSLSGLPGTLERVKELEADPAYDIKVPNLVRSVVGAFTQNLVNFHHESGSGYVYAADRIMEIDAFNPSISSMLAKAFKLYPRVDAGRKEHMKRQLERIADLGDLSKNTREIVEKTLENSSS
ncbi:MAG: aminopeptidase N [Spirochaetae bacterium HGW-Spirochaetae-1]|nr:MAG: aminopeptidase N [Spirochaetae bacterium HGW-Spirochaetae-1]